MIPHFFLSTGCLMRLLSANRPELISVGSPQHMIRKVFGEPLLKKMDE